MPIHLRSKTNPLPIRPTSVIPVSIHSPFAKQNKSVPYPPHQRHPCSHSLPFCEAKQIRSVSAPSASSVLPFTPLLRSKTNPFRIRPISIIRTPIHSPFAKQTNSYPPKKSPLPNYLISCTFAYSQKKPSYV